MSILTEDAKVEIADSRLSVSNAKNLCKIP
jgi:hypothetical protein